MSKIVDLMGKLWDWLLAGLGLVLGLATTVAILATFVKWLIWAGQGWLW